jgi:hypothetical protein
MKVMLPACLETKTQLRVRWLHISGLLGVLSITISTATYAYEQTFMTFVTPALASYFTEVAGVYLLAVLAGITLVLMDLRRSLRKRVVEIGNLGMVPLSPAWLIPYVLSTRRYWKFFVSSAVLYGIFYAFVTSMVVYQPTVDFVQTYGADIPSAIVTPCCGPPLFTPIVTVYVVNHLGLLLIPLTLLLLLAISTLVGLNTALAAFAFDSRTKETNRGWVGGLGAVVGLFTGCPTCAGLFFANILGGSGAVSFAAILAYYQPVFILVSLPVLLLTLYLTSRSLGRVFREGCVILESRVA